MVKEKTKAARRRRRLNLENAFSSSDSSDAAAHGSAVERQQEHDQQEEHDEEPRPSTSQGTAQGPKTGRKRLHDGPPEPEPEQSKSCKFKATALWAEKAARRSNNQRQEDEDAMQQALDGGARAAEQQLVDEVFEDARSNFADDSETSDNSSKAAERAMCQRLKDFLEHDRAKRPFVIPNGEELEEGPPGSRDAQAEEAAENAVDEEVDQEVLRHAFLGGGTSYFDPIAESINSDSPNLDVNDVMQAIVATTLLHNVSKAGFNAIWLQVRRFLPVLYDNRDRLLSGQTYRKRLNKSIPQTMVQCCFLDVRTGLTFTTPKRSAFPQKQYGNRNKFTKLYELWTVHFDDVVAFHQALHDKPGQGKQRRDIKISFNSDGVPIGKTSRSAQVTSVKFSCCRYEF